MIVKILLIIAFALPGIGFCTKKGRDRYDQEAGLGGVLAGLSCLISFVILLILVGGQ